MARESSLSQAEWNAKFSGGSAPIAVCAECDLGLKQRLGGVDDPVRTAGWLPCLERRWVCPSCWSQGVWQHVHVPVVASVWLVADSNDGVDECLPTGRFLIEGNGLTGAEGWWLCDGWDSVAAPVGSWLVVEDRRVRVEPFEWLGRLMVEAGVMADEPF